MLIFIAMKKITLLSVLLIFTFYASSAQSWVWAKNITNGDKNFGTSIGADNQKNIYVTGNPLFCKFNQYGNVLWTNTTVGGKSVTDSNGNTYTGEFSKYNNAGQKIWTTASIG